MDFSSFDWDSLKFEFGPYALRAVLEADKIVWVNEAFAQTLGYSKEQIVGQSIMSLSPSDHHHYSMERIERQRDGVFTNVGHSRDGRQLQFVGEAVLNQLNGQEYRFIGCRALTAEEEQSQAVQALLASRELLNEALQEKDAALRQLLRQLSIENRRPAVDFDENLRSIVFPTLEQLKSTSGPSAQNQIERLETALRDISSPFGVRLQQKAAGLSPREVEICYLVKAGHSSKAIADVLTISPQTVSAHRKTIRKKLGLANRGTNLVTYLRSLEEIG